MKSCFNCKYLGQLDKSDNSQWDCKHPNNKELTSQEITPDPNYPTCRGIGYLDADTGVPTSMIIGIWTVVDCSCWDESDDETLADFYARNCPGYEFFNWKETPSVVNEAI
jgi:hypothetical protein